MAERRQQTKVYQRQEVPRGAEPVCGTSPDLPHQEAGPAQHDAVLAARLKRDEGLGGGLAQVNGV